MNSESKSTDSGDLNSKKSNEKDGISSTEPIKRTGQSGVLAEFLEPILEKNLIPVDLDTWKFRRRARWIVPRQWRSFKEI
ncbi:hypothetical protein Bca52824_008231 [Brassica carinata]|nr:hypothetical protein Bca52824_008231 [Brassica carinata]